MSEVICDYCGDRVKSSLIWAVCSSCDKNKKMEWMKENVSYKEMAEYLIYLEQAPEHNEGYGYYGLGERVKNPLAWGFEESKVYREKTG